jgi:hypothetical protein
MGTYVGVDYNLAYVISRVDFNTFRVPWAFGNPMPESTLTLARVDFIPKSGTKDLASV